MLLTRSSQRPRVPAPPPVRLLRDRPPSVVHGGLRTPQRQSFYDRPLRQECRQHPLGNTSTQTSSLGTLRDSDESVRVLSNSSLIASHFSFFIIKSYSDLVAFAQYISPSAGWPRRLLASISFLRPIRHCSMPLSGVQFWNTLKRGSTLPLLWFTEGMLILDVNLITGGRAG